MAWQDNASSYLNNTSESDKEANICIIGDLESFGNNVSDFYFVLKSNYDQQLDAFNELHEESKKLIYYNNRIKGENKWLDNRLKLLKEENENLKIDLDTLEMDYNNSSCNCFTNRTSKTSQL